MDRIFSCTALYKPQAGNTDLRFEKLTLHVLFPPKETTIIIEPKGPHVLVMLENLKDATISGRPHFVQGSFSGINSSKVDVIYANKAFLEEREVAEEEPLHYVNVDFAKLQAHSKGKPGEGEIRGLDSKTEYAEIRLQSRGSIGGDAEEEENVSDTQLEQEKTP
ncbi:hypothetical protein KUCAC02_013616 [Chaenocephalus aceratus]|uniref:Uncharacterized protein n=1 Tax=Chaenocephalus aceratus TaxID=36190 RepID=A0ACB9WC09_CHAAC|nr:hypothetical protein KUCAC02_013616 [Chaenocephalus aceratus]